MNKKSFWKSPVLYYVSLTSLAILLTRLFQFVLLDWLTVFLFPLLLLVLLILAIVGLIWSIVFWIRSDHKSGFPLIVQIAGITLGIFIPFERLWLVYNFQHHLPARQQVIALIQTNQIKSSDITELPPLYRSTSMGGDVQITQQDGSLSVVFFTLRVMGGAQGFVYREAATPMPSDLFPGYQVLQQQPIVNSWYYTKIGTPSKHDE